MATSESRSRESDYRLGFVTQDREVVVDDLPVSGTIPDWLSGTLIRNGPAQFEVGTQSYRHWFDGLAMLHRFAFSAGQVSYANRFLQSRAYSESMQKGRIRFGEFATDPCRSIFGRVFSWFSPRSTDNANVHISRIAERHVALTETPMPVEFDPQTLDTLGVMDYGDRLGGQIASVHPHHDLTRSRLVSYGIRFARRSEYQIFEIAPGETRRELVASAPVTEPGYVHSFGLTERYVVLAEFPLVVHPLRLRFSTRPFIENYRWKPDRSTRLFVWDRGSGDLKGIYETEPCFAFHHVNAFEERDHLVVDLAAYADAAIIESLYLDRLRDETRTTPAPDFRRLRIPLAGGPVTQEVLVEETIELPRINYRMSSTRDYQYAYGVGRSSNGRFLDQLLKANVKVGSSNVWRQDGCYPGEPVFVARPAGSAEDDGVVLSVVLNPGRGTSFLLILDAATFQELGRAEVPQHIPFGLHGNYSAD